MTRKLFGFAGRKRSGKSALCKYLKQEEGAIIVTVANYLKYLCCDLMNMGYDELLEKKDNGYTFNIIPDNRWVEIIHKRTNISKENLMKELEGVVFTNIRQLLQVLGTDIIRKYDKDWHVKQMVEEIESYPKDKLIVIDDVRFPNEKEAIEKLGGITFFIIRPYCRGVSNHISETSLVWKDFSNDRVLLNNLTENEFFIHFMTHYRNNFDVYCPNSILLSENSKFIENGDFGYNTNIDEDELLYNILIQIKNDDFFLNYGVIKFKTCMKHLANEYYKRVLKQNPSNQLDPCNTFVTFNPLITENLKLYL